jgi:ArsR family transcriptional regulator
MSRGIVVKMLEREQLEAVAGTFAVLAEPTRLAILQRLKGGPCSVGTLVTDLGLRQANVSKQLGLLQDAGLVARRRDGNFVIYSIAEPMIFDLCELVCSKLKRDFERQAKMFRRAGA